MNALANDQKQRIDDYLSAAGIAGASASSNTTAAQRRPSGEEMRHNPPHLLLTNYMMLEYLLVRPSDREDIFANHRCRFLVLDEVHTYRGILGSNIALLVRRLKTHLARARQDWRIEVSAEEQPRRFPELVPVGTSATIKSMNEEGLTQEEVIQLRDTAVQEFFATLTGVEKTTIRVLGEELQDVEIPPEARYPAAAGPSTRRRSTSPTPTPCVRRSATLADLPPETHAVRGRAPLSAPLGHESLAHQAPDVAEPDRRTGHDPRSRNVEQTSEDQIQREVESALVIGAALPEEIAGTLRLRSHRFVRGGWKFHRCLNPACRKIYPLGEEHCRDCHHLTAPLYLCRNCGADYLRVVGELDEDKETLRPSAIEGDGPEWMIYQPERVRVIVAPRTTRTEEGKPEVPRRRRANRAPKQIRGRPVLTGSLDPGNPQVQQRLEIITLSR